MTGKPNDPRVIAFPFKSLIFFSTSKSNRLKSNSHLSLFSPLSIFGYQVWSLSYREDDFLLIQEVIYYFICTIVNMKTLIYKIDSWEHIKSLKMQTLCHLKGIIFSIFNNYIVILLLHGTILSDLHYNKPLQPL